MAYPEKTVAVCEERETVIVVDDGCYEVRCAAPGDAWYLMPYISASAMRALRTLPDDPRDAVPIGQPARGKTLDGNVGDLIDLVLRLRDRVEALEARLADPEG